MRVKSQAVFQLCWSSKFHVSTGWSGDICNSLGNVMEELQIFFFHLVPPCARYATYFLPG